MASVVQMVTRGCYRGFQVACPTCMHTDERMCDACIHGIGVLPVNMLTTGTQQLVGLDLYKLLKNTSFDIGQKQQCTKAASKGIPCKYI